jgi:hypothetical protein
MPESAGGRGQGSVQIGFGYTSAFYGEPRATFGLARDVDLDLNLLLLDLQKGGMNAVMAGAGVHYRVPLRNRYLRLSFTAGLAVGRGGYRCDDEGENCRTPDWAVSPHVGIDLGLRIRRVFGLYLGNRYAASRAEDVPLTHWGYHVLGLHFDWTRRFFSNLETGFYYWFNSHSGLNVRNSHLYSTMIYVTILGVRWGTKR